MIRFFVLVFVFSQGAAVNAATYEVRSGEHADFSRIVVLIDEVPEWTLGKTSKGYALRTTEPSTDYDVSAVFQFIPKTRLLSLGKNPAGDLEFELDCDCHADAFEIRSGLVIDFKDGAPNANSRFEVALPKIEAPSSDPENPLVPIAEPAYPNFARSDSYPASIFEHLTAPRTQFAWRTDLVSDAVESNLLKEPSSDPAIIIQTKPPNEDVAKVQSDLIMQLGRAASQGLIAADLSQTEALIEELPIIESGHVVTPDIEISMNRHEILSAQDDDQNVHFETAIDRSGGTQSRRSEVNNDGIACFDSEYLDVANWGMPPTDQREFTLSRAEIYGEFDEVDRKQVEKIAKQYLYFTFGAEARALIEALDANFENAPLLENFADIMDSRQIDTPSLDSTQLQCESSAALWAALMIPSLPRSGQIAKASVLASFADLPLHLRRHLGPKLAEKFLEIGDKETATAIKDSIGRAPGDHGDSFTMMVAEIALSDGELDAGTEQLNSVIQADGTNAPLAVVQLIDARLNAGQDVRSELVSSAAALASEARGTAIGMELKRVFLRSKVHSSDGLQVLRETENATSKGEITEAAAAAIRQEIYEFAASDPSDINFLSLVLEGPLQLNDSSDATESRRAIASRLIELELPIQARNILSEVATVPEYEDRKIYARAFLAERRPDLAMGYLAGMSDPDSILLRALAQTQAGEFDRAAENFSAVNNMEASARSLWRGQMWAKVAEEGTEQERAAAKLLADPDNSEDEPNKILAMNREMLERSQNARAILANLMDSAAIP